MYTKTGRIINDPDASLRYSMEYHRITKQYRPYKYAAKLLAVLVGILCYTCYYQDKQIKLKDQQLKILTDSIHAK